MKIYEFNTLFTKTDFDLAGKTIIAISESNKMSSAKWLQKCNREECLDAVMKKIKLFLHPNR